MVERSLDRGTDRSPERSAERAPLSILPRELGQVPPPLQLVGQKARGLAQLMALKARVPRFGIITVEAYDAHLQDAEVQAALAAARREGLPDEAARLAHGDALCRAVLRAPPPVALRIALQDVLSAFAFDDLLAVRASVIGEPRECAAVAGAFDATLCAKGQEALEEAVLRAFALAFHPRTLGLREKAGLPALGTRMGLVIQRMVLAESSGVCQSLEVDARPGASARALLRSTWGLGGGIGGRHGTPRIPRDAHRVERPAGSAEGIDDQAGVDVEVVHKSEALRLDEQKGQSARMQPVLEHLKKEPCLSAVQARMVAREALRLEAAFGRPQAVTFAFAGRLLHVLDIEPLLVPVSRVESQRARTWDDRIVPEGLARPLAPLSFSVWQKGTARGIERAGRILGVRGVVLEETRPALPRVLGSVSGRVYGNVEVLTALLDLLPFADKARAALAGATGQPELVPRKAPPPGFWQRTRARFDDSRWPTQLERISEVAQAESERLRGEAQLSCERARVDELAHADPDELLDTFDELEDALSKVLAALSMSGLAAALFHAELMAESQETELHKIPGLVFDLLGGDAPAEVTELTVRVHRAARLVRESPALSQLFAQHRTTPDALAQSLGLYGDGEGGSAAAAADPVVGPLHTELSDLLRARCALVEGELALEAPRLRERPDRLVELVGRVAQAAPVDLDAKITAAQSARKNAEYTADQALALVGGLKGSTLRKRFGAALTGARAHGRDALLLWHAVEDVVAQLRRTGLLLGERLFEHNLLDQPADVLLLEGAEIASLVRGTGVDTDARPLVAARRRQAIARPQSLPRRLETRGVVSTSLLDGSQEEERAPSSAATTWSGTAASGGSVTDAALVILDDVAGPAVPGGVCVVPTVTLGDLPLLLCAKGVVAERGTVFSPAVAALRALGVPTVVEVAGAVDASTAFRVSLDAGRGVLTRLGAPAPAVATQAPSLASSDGSSVGPRSRLSGDDAEPFTPPARSAPLAAPEPRTQLPAPAPEPPAPFDGVERSRSVGFARVAVVTDPGMAALDAAASAAASGVSAAYGVGDLDDEITERAPPPTQRLARGPAGLSRELPEPAARPFVSREAHRVTTLPSEEEVSETDIVDQSEVE